MRADFTETTRVDGSSTDGIYEDQMSVPAYVESGAWETESFYLAGQLGNDVWLNAQDFATLAFPTTSEVR